MVTLLVKSDMYLSYNHSTLFLLANQISISDFCLGTLPKMDILISLANCLTYVYQNNMSQYYREYYMVTHLPVGLAYVIGW